MMFGESIPKDDYLDHKALGSSAIGVAASNTVAHYLAKKKKEETPSQRLGTLDHLALLEPELLKEHYQLIEQRQCEAVTGKGGQCSRTALAGASHCTQHGGQAAVDLWHEQNPKKELLREDELEKLTAMAKGVRARLDMFIGADGRPLTWLLDESEHERSLFASASQDSSTGEFSFDPITASEALALPGSPERITVRSRMDIIVPKNHLALDLKGTRRGLDRWKWRYQIRDYNLHIQASLYRSILKAHTGEEWDWGWIAHEAEAPFDVAVRQPARADLDAGDIAVQRGLWRWMTYFESGNPWEGCSTGIETVAMSDSGYDEEM